MSLMITENIGEALRAVKSQLLRTTLTILIISVGMMALVGILTSIDAIKSSISSNFSDMGANTFSIRNFGSGIRIGSGGKKAKSYPRISYREAISFKDRLDFPAYVSVSTRASSMATLKYASRETNPNTFIFGADENYLITSGYEMEEGRNFSPQDIELGSNSIIIGQDIVDDLFPNESALEKVIAIAGKKFTVIGILKSKGSSMGFSGDKNALIPLSTARQKFSQANPTFLINVMVDQPQKLDPAIGEATSLFRTIRKNRPGAESTFEISRSDSMSKMLIDNMGVVSISATVIGLITLLGAAIGLMNIMLVSVTERTREIGVRKAIGASSKTIRNQFLVEAIVICQLGGVFGIVLGIAIGNLVGSLMGAEFIIPWMWMLLGFALCLLVGLASGLYPAHKASELDPIEALRYE